MDSSAGLLITGTYFSVPYLLHGLSPWANYTDRATAAFSVPTD
jgi:hypothetical protein